MSPPWSRGPYGLDPNKHLTVMLVKYHGDLHELRNKRAKLVKDEVSEYDLVHVRF